MTSFEKVAWKSLNKQGISGKESKSHLMTLGAEKTLCGTVIPPQNQLSEEYLNGECKRCATKAEKLLTQTVKETIAKEATVQVTIQYAFIDWLNKLTKNETLPRGQFFKGKK